jgi:hypothetical protein
MARSNIDGAQVRVRRRQRRSARLVLAVGLAVSLAGTLLAMAIVGRSAGRARAATAAPASAVHQVLQRLRGDWAERDAGRLVPSSLSVEQCRQELPAILAEPGHALFRPAVVLTRHLGLVDLVELLVAALPHADPGVQPLLVAAVEQLRPWDADELEELIDSDSGAVAVAALAAAGARGPAGLESLVEQLVAPDAGKRAAALSALPVQLSRRQAEQLMAALADPAAVQSAEALLALSRCADVPDFEDFVASRLHGSDESVAAALDALAARGEPLAQPERVLGVFQDARRPMRKRALAQLSIDRTTTHFDAHELDLRTGQGPLLDYLAARLLIQAQRAIGLQLLVDVVRAPDDTV